VLQKEAAVSDVDVDGKSTVNADFLMGATDFTILVEMKLPSSELFKGTSTQRSRTWGLSIKLMDAVSQILTQKAEWLVKSRGENFDENEQLIEQRAVDPKAILIIGMRSSMTGTDREQMMKLNTFELFRRDSRNIEIITYDELYDRAFYIVNQRLPEDADRLPPIEDESAIEVQKAGAAISAFDDIPF